QERTQSPTTGCRILTKPFVSTFNRGDVIGLYDAPVLLTRAQDNQLFGPTLQFQPADGMPLVVLHDVGRVRIRAATSFFPPRICTGTVGTAPVG
ncbi:MAG TPA: hypothetical protein VEZ15_18080, partial [Acidimicrobiia bacterium]|nr:hypothetical protein [Acidimicrobiia bacterium]